MRDSFLYILPIKNGIPSERVLNLIEILFISDILKYNEIVKNPRECETCGTILCEECINQWSKIKTIVLQCSNFKHIKVKKKIKKF